MEQLPKIVIERLRAAEAPNAHPDADQLTALAENSLREGERSAVLEHLAACAECREVLSFGHAESRAMVAAAAGAAVVAPARQPVRDWRPRWPMLRWGALAACVVVAGAVVLLRRPSREQQPTLLASKKALHIVVAAGDSSKKEPSRETPSSSNAPAARSVSPQPTASTPSAEVVRQLSELKLRQNKLAEKDRDRLASSGVGALTAPAPPIAMSPAHREREVGALAQDAKSEKEAFPNAPNAQPEEAQSGAKSAVADAMSTKVGDARGALAKSANAQSASGAAGVGPGFKPHRDEALVRAVATPPRRWTISSTGKVLRSLDAGNSWHEVSVGGEGIFRALSVSGSDIWVGGNKGELYHSSDYGEHWAELKPAVEGTTLNSDIVHIEFTDDKRGFLTTATQGTWSTSDGGITWQKK
jgi:hypothetical protein